MKRIFSILLLLIVVFSGYTQIRNNNKLVYVNPYPSSVYNNPEVTVTLGFAEKLTKEDLGKIDIQLYDVNNIKQATHTIFPENGKNLILKPNKKLSQGKYMVKIFMEEKVLKSFDFWVTKSTKTKNAPHTFKFPENNISNILKINAAADEYRAKYNLPSSFPAIDITYYGNPGGGYYILNRLWQTNELPQYLIIMDTLGFPVYYKTFNLANAVQDFYLQEETGYLTYYKNSDSTYVAVDSSYNIMATYEAANGYKADGHELIVLEDGSYWIMIYDPQLVDMSQIVPQGQVNAIVTGLIIQHIDNLGNVLFEWKSWDHMEITDADPAIVNLGAGGIDYVHGNALDFDGDGNLLLSSRNLSEITKINVNTGEIMWRFGGTQNEFQIINDSINFSAQHHIRYLGNDLYSLYDNGWGRSFKFSRGLVYDIDTITMTAILVRDDNNVEDMVFSPFMGSYDTGPSNEKLMGWSYNLQSYVISEYDEEDNLVLEMKSLEALDLISYRAIKTFWETNAISFDEDVYLIEDVNVNESKTLEFEVTNNLTENFNLNGFNSSDPAFTLVEGLPQVFLPGESKTLHIEFTPTQEKQYSAAISLYTDNFNRRIAKQFRINTDIVLSNNEFVTSNGDITIYPNPAKEVLNIDSNEGQIMSVDVFSLSGKKVISQKKLNTQYYSIDLESLPKGIYFINLLINNLTYNRKFIID